MYKIVTIVSLYKSGRWLDNRLDNLAKTTSYLNKELLIYLVDCNENADNDSYLIADNYRHRFQHIVYDRVGPCTVYAAWNHAIGKTESEFITIANSDDIISPHCYDLLVKACGTEPNIAYPDYYVLSKENQKWPPTEYSHIHRNQQIDFKQRRPKYHSCGHFPLWRRSCHEIVGLFDPEFKASGDLDFWRRCWLSERVKFKRVQKPIGGYLFRKGQNLWHRIDKKTRAEEYKKIFSRKDYCLNLAIDS